MHLFVKRDNTCAHTAHEIGLFHLKMNKQYSILKPLEIIVLPTNLNR